MAMKHLLLPSCQPRRLPFYLAMEEWASRYLPAGEYFFAWRVEPTVICGRNQDIESEVDTDYCRREGIDVVRRRSGGGAVYADMNNYMFSYITPSDEVASTFSRYTTMICAMLGSLGIDAKATGRNDILIDGAKVAGNAFYHLPGRSIVHGTMLYDFDPSRLMRALTPSRAKMQSKGLVSVTSRVTSLSRVGLDMGIDDFGRYAISYLTDSELMLTPADIEAIEAIEQEYYDPAFIKGRHSGDNHKCDISRHCRIDGVGEFDAAINLADDSTIAAMGLWGDFFVTGDIDADIAAHLIGVKYDRDTLSKAINTINTETIITGLSQEKLLNILI